MSCVFEGQTMLTIRLDTGLDNLNESTTHDIDYEKPNGDTGSFTASVLGKKLVYNFEDGDIDMSGNWKFHTHVVIAGLEAWGDIFEQMFDERLKPVE
jgi:hypothetical protein